MSTEQYFHSLVQLPVAVGGSRCRWAVCHVDHASSVPSVSLPLSSVGHCDFISRSLRSQFLQVPAAGGQRRAVLGSLLPRRAESRLLRRRPSDPLWSLTLSHSRASSHNTLVQPSATHQQQSLQSKITTPWREMEIWCSVVFFLTFPLGRIDLARSPNLAHFWTRSG